MSVLDQACEVFTGSTGVAAGGQYIFHIPRRGVAHVGIGCHRTVSYSREGFTVTDTDGSRTVACAGDPIAQAPELLDPEHASFWIISPDLARRVHDPSLPLIHCIQPVEEVTIELPGDADREGIPLPDQLAQGWQTQSDEAFLDRLRSGIATLQAYPDGKMIITRSYRRDCAGRDPFALFKVFAASEPAAACSHFLRIGDHAVSLGCSPENVFEVRGGRLVFDVVAATRGKSSDPATDARWREALRNDPKERREHMMAFERYLARIEGLVQPGSVEIECQLEVLELGNVRHLFSRASGTLREDRDWRGILADSFPALVSYPDALQDAADPQIEPLRFYGGILGRVSADGQDAAFFLNLRAALIAGDALHTQGGVGVIAQSEPDKELLEVRNKLTGLFKAVAAWEAIPAD